MIFLYCFRNDFSVALISALTLLKYKMYTYTCMYVRRRPTDMGRLLGTVQLFSKRELFPPVWLRRQKGGSDFNSDIFGINNVPG